MLDGLSTVTEAFPRTVRLVATARLRDPVLLDLVDGADLEALAEIEGATSQRRIAEARGSAGLAANELIHAVPHARFINASFSYSKPREPNRFNGADRGAWYSAFDLKTALEEVKFHLTEMLAQTGVFEAVVEYGEMHASFAGEFLDLRQHSDHPALHPDRKLGYPVGNALADAVRAEGLNGIVYPSVRHPGGTCIAALFPHAVQSVAQGDVHRMTWTGDPNPEIVKL